MIFGRCQRLSWYRKKRQTNTGPKANVSDSRAGGCASGNPQPRIEETPEQAMVFDRLAKREKPRGSGHHWFNLPWPPTRTEIIAVIGVLLIAVAGVTSYIMLKPDKPAKPVAVTKPVKKKLLSLLLLHPT